MRDKRTSPKPEKKKPTGSRRADEARLARDRAQAIVEIVGQPLLILDDSLVIRSANRAFHDIFQCSAAEIDARKITEVQGGAWNLPALTDKLDDLLHHESRIEGLDIAFSSPKLGERQLLLRARRLEQLAGQPPLILLAIEDVTLRESEARFRLTFEHAAVGMALIDIDGRWLRVNHKLCAMLGYGREELLSKNLSDVIHPYNLAAHRMKLGQLLDGTSCDAPREERYVRGDGTIVWVETSFVMVRGASSSPAHSVLVVVDITERKRDERELDRLLALEQDARREAESARFEAESASLAKDQFLAMISHELRSPLQGIVLSVDAIRRGLPPERLERALGSIQRSVSQQTRLVNDLLDISSIMAGKVQLQARVLDIGQVVRRAVESAAPMAERKHLELIADINNCGYVLGEEPRLHQVISNLLANAIKFTPERGKIEVQCVEHNGACKISVKDSGEGIAPEFLPNIFDRFSQADPTITRRHGGLGLGLAIVRTLVELHGGTVVVESAGIGLGATFTVTLALVTEPPAIKSPALPRPSDRDTPMVSGDRPEILLVDDDAHVLDAMAVALGVWGLRIRTASSAEAALKEFNDRRPHVVISDVAMPGYDGKHLIREIRKIDNGQTPAIALTGLARGSDHREIVEAGFDEYVSKPIAPESLIELISSLLQRRRACSDSQ